MHTSEIEEIATDVRRFWNLGDGPISNVTLLLENNGAIVTRTEMGADNLDADTGLDRFWLRSFPPSPPGADCFEQ